MLSSFPANWDTTIFISVFRTTAFPVLLPPMKSIDVSLYSLAIPNRAQTTSLLNRVFCDFLTETNHFMDIPSIYRKKAAPFSTGTAITITSILRNMLKNLWNKGKIDLILSRSINNLGQLDELQIPYEAVFPNEEMIRNSIQHALDELRLDSITEQRLLSIFLRLPFTEEVEKEEQEYREASVYKFLTEYRKENHFPFAIEKGFNQFSISTGLSPETELMPLLQEILSACRQNLNFPFRMGIGVSSSKERSRYYAEHALMESNRYGRNDAFFMEEEGKLLGPLSQKLKLLTDYSNPKALQFAKEQGIHESNILKLISLFENDPEQALSAQYIAELLAITPPFRQ